MNETHQNLIRIGTDILSASRNELYLSMRFLDLALSGLRYEMNLSSLYVGTDGEKILFNPRYLVQRYLSDRVLVNRAYLHMVLHCLFRHPFHLNHRDEELWHLACDIAVESIVDSLSVKAVRLVVSDKRNEMYDMLRRELKVLSAEGIYRVLEEKKLSLQEFGKLQLEFWVDDHVFWEHQKDDEDENNKDGDNQDNSNDQQQEQEEEELVGGVGQKEWGWELVGGWGHTQARAWAHTSHQSVSGVVLSHGCVCGKRSALIHTTTTSSSRRRTRVDKDRKDKDWWDKKKEGVAPTPPHTTNKPESTMVVSQTTTPTQNHNNKKKKRKRKGEKGRWKQEEEREGQQAQGTVSVLVGCGTHVAQTTHHIHSTHRERETGKGKGQEKRQRKTKDKEWCMGVVVMEKQEASKLVTHHHFAPHFFPTPFFSLPPFLPLPFFPFSKLPT